MARTQAGPGVALSELRRAAGISQAQLAARVGTTQSAVARLEGGRLSPSLRTLERAYAALGHRLQLFPAPLRSSYEAPLRSTYPQARREPALLVAESARTRYRTQRTAAVDLSQIRAARRLPPGQRLDRLAAAVRGVAELRAAIEQ